MVQAVREYPGFEEPSADNQGKPCPSRAIPMVSSMSETQTQTQARASSSSTIVPAAFKSV